MSPGNYVQAAYEAKGDKKVVTELQRHIGLDGSDDPLLSIQAPGD